MDKLQQLNNESKLTNYNTVGIESSNTVLSLVNEYKVLIDKFKINSDVLTGGLGFKSDGINVADGDRPASIGYGLGQTGFCVSASKMLLESFALQEFLNYRNASAKLISIDIKEQYYGQCYNGSQNYWHTAILVQDYVEGQKYLFVIDITIRQFGNEFVGHDIWDFNTWKDKLRSPNCTHKISDFDGVEYSILPLNTLTDNKGIAKYNELRFVGLKDNLKRNITLSNSDREVISDFIFNKVDLINNSIILGSIDAGDQLYLSKVKNVLEQLYYQYNHNTLYSLLKFNNRQSLANWTKILTSNSTTPQFLMLFNSVEKACDFYGLDIDDLNNTLTSNGDAYLIIKYEPNSIIHPALESSLIDGFINYNQYINITELCNTGTEIDKEFNTIRCIVSKDD